MPSSSHFAILSPLKLSQELDLPSTSSLIHCKKSSKAQTLHRDASGLQVKDLKTRLSFHIDDFTYYYNFAQDDIDNIKDRLSYIEDDLCSKAKSDNYLQELKQKHSHLISSRKNLVIC